MNGRSKEKQNEEIKKALRRENKIRALCLVITTVLALVAVPTGSYIVASAKKATAKETIVIDPGHGGFDGGAQSESGTSEKDINLSIANEIKRLAEKDGYRVVMTRSTDTELGESESTSIRSRKTADLIARKKIIDDMKPLLTISIHLNSFKEDKSVRGAQVFYPKGSEDDEVIMNSKILAEAIQSELALGIADGTNRQVLSKGDVRILKNVYTPIALVECGFLSNYEEAKLLESEEYQQKIAKCIYKGVEKYTHFK